MAVTEMTDCGRWVCFGPQKARFQFRSENSADTWWVGSDDEVGATGERQQNIEQSDSGDQRKEKGSCSSQRPWSNH